MKLATILLAAGVICTALPAQAGICTNEIAMISKMLSGGGLGSAASALPSASTGTLGGVAGGAAMGTGTANPAAVKQAAGAVDQAKVADAAGNETSCMDYIKQAKQLLGMIK